MRRDGKISRYMFENAIYFSLILGLVLLDLEVVGQGPYLERSLETLERNWLKRSGILMSCLSLRRIFIKNTPIWLDVQQ